MYNSLAGPRIRVAVALEHQGRVLLVRHQKGNRTYWLVPGGGVEYGESVQQAAIREMEEETGLRVEMGDLVLVAETLAPDLSRHVVHLIFRGRTSGGIEKLGQEPIGEDGQQRLAELKWVPFEELSSLVLHPPIADRLVEALRSEKAQLGFADGLWID